MKNRKYKNIAFDINDIHYHIEFTDFKKMNEWISSKINKDRKIEYITPQEYKWLIKQPVKNKRK